MRHILIIIISLLLIALVLYSCNNIKMGTKKALKEGSEMMKEPIVEKGSVSEILRSSVILVIRLDEVTSSPWVKEAQGDLLVRKVTMKVVIEQILKGNVRQKVGESFKLEVTQRGTGGFRVMDYYGLWSHVPLSSGVRFVAFCRGISDDATVLLTDVNCEQLVDPNIALADVKVALELESQNLSATDLLAKATELSNQRGDIFARYVWARVKSKAITSFDTFEALVKILEDPKTTERARDSYLTSISEELGMREPALRQWEIRFIQAMFKLLTLPEAKFLHSDIEEVYLPGILGLDNDAPRYSADEVFKTRPDDRQSILSILKYGTKRGFIPRLIQWLEANGLGSDPLWK